jgi:hypothetical protein
MVVTNLLLLVIALLLVCLPVALSDQLKTQPTNGSSEIILQYEGNSQKIFGKV